jgi:hypothetical protein
MNTVTITTAEIRAAWDVIQAGRSPFSRQPQASSKLPRYRGSEVDAWVGASGAQIQDRLHHGHYVDAAQIDLPGGDVEIGVPMPELVEEDGDLIVSQALGGEDLCFARWEEFEAKRGLTIRADITMSCGTESRVMTDYMEWILSVVDAAERKGIAPSVELLMDVTGLFAGDQKGRVLVRIPLVEAGQIVDVVAWRAYLAPGAFRSLGFVGLWLAGDKLRKQCIGSLGRPSRARWEIEFADDVLTIGCPVSPNAFPREVMEAKLQEVYS